MGLCLTHCFLSPLVINVHKFGSAVRGGPEPLVGHGVTCRSREWMPLLVSGAFLGFSYSLPRADRRSVI